jgi:hypothetical protein
MAAPRHQSKGGMSQVAKLDVLMSKDFDHAAGVGPWVPLPDVIALGIGPYSRRFQDLRKLYLSQGFDVENRVERGGGVNRSWYRKIRKGYPQAERPETSFQSPQIRKARRSTGAWKAQPIVPTKSWEEWDRERNQPKPEPEFQLVP